MPAVHIAINAWFWNCPTTGSGQFTRQLVEHLGAIAPDREILLVAPSDRVAHPGTPAPNIRFWPIGHGRRLPENLHKVWFEQVAFPRACRTLRANVAHVPYWAPPLSPPIPTIVTIHDLIPLLLPEYRGGPKVRLYTLLVSRAAQRAALVLTDSESSQRDIVAHLRLPGSRVRVVPLAAAAQFAPQADPADEASRQQYALPERYMLYLGGFDVRKNIVTALMAYHQASAAIGPACPLILAGRLPSQDSPFTPDPRRIARELRMGEGLARFLGPVDEAAKPALYRGALAFIFPSRYEGFGLPALEALACGTPVIGSDASSIPEVVGEGGALFPPGDVAGMAGALSRLATDAGYRAELSRRAVAQASSFSWQRTARETLLAYDELAIGARRSAIDD